MTNGDFPWETGDLWSSYGIFHIVFPRFDVTGVGSDNGLPYMCIAFSKHPLSTVNISFQGDSVITTCDLIPQGLYEQEAE